MSERFAPPRGTQDVLPPTSDRLEALAGEAASLARSFGYRRVETPTFEHTELFARGVGATTDIVTKEMYTFHDKGGRSLTLRPEGTAGVVRAYLANRQQLPTPFKGYYVVPMFRHERPQAGRMRQHTQFGIEVIGSEGPEADAEVIAVGHRFLSRWGVAFELRVNSIGDPVCRPAYREALLSFLRERRDRLSEDCRQRMEENPLRVLDCKIPSCREATADAPSILDYLDEACREHFAAVRERLDEQGMEHVVDPRLVRGLDYYTRTAFEFVSPNLGPTQSTLCGGGRYDGLAEEIGGPPTPGIGFGLGLERLLLAIEREGLAPPETPSTGVFVVALGEEGVSAEHALEARPLGAQLKMADRAGAAYAAILGDDELAAGEVTMRDMATGEQERVKRTEVGTWLTSR